MCVCVCVCVCVRTSVFVPRRRNPVVENPVPIDGERPVKNRRPTAGRGPTTRRPRTRQVAAAKWRGGFFNGRRREEKEEEGEEEEAAAEKRRWRTREIIKGQPSEETRDSDAKVVDDDNARHVVHRDRLIRRMGPFSSRHSRAFTEFFFPPPPPPLPPPPPPPPPSSSFSQPIGAEAYRVASGSTTGRVFFFSQHTHNKKKDTQPIRRVGFEEEKNERGVGQKRGGAAEKKIGKKNRETTRKWRLKMTQKDPARFNGGR